MSFARVESILPDHKKDWYQIKLLMLQIPLQVVIWILKDAYINGDDFFMNGKKMRLDVVKCPGPELEALDSGQRDSDSQADKKKSSSNDSALPPGTPTPETGNLGDNIISFAAIRNNKNEDPEPDIG